LDFQSGVCPYWVFRNHYASQWQRFFGIYEGEILKVEKFKLILSQSCDQGPRRNRPLRYKPLPYIQIGNTPNGITLAGFQKRDTKETHMIEVRFHGRGGQGAKIASRILGQSAFLSGLYAQDFALFGAERRGAPVVSCTRIGAEPISQRGYIERPSLVVVMDPTLIKEAAAQVFHGVDSSTPLFINAQQDQFATGEQELPPAHYIFIDFTRIARELIGRAFISAAAAGAAAKCIPAVKLSALAEAVRSEIAEFGLPPVLIDRNEAAARKAYEDAPLVDLSAVAESAEPIEPSLQAVPYLGSAEFAGPTIRHRGSAALRATGNWRVERPEVDLEKCKRCFLCYLYCPDAAIALDSDNFPHVDYEHCKGCMICYEECPTDAITRRLEV
jgi:pyruvate ferredoxin oxidoreductase gamma subunit